MKSDPCLLLDHEYNKEETSLRPIIIESEHMLYVDKCVNCSVYTTNIQSVFYRIKPGLGDLIMKTSYPQSGCPPWPDHYMDFCRRFIDAVMFDKELHIVIPNGYYKEYFDFVDDRDFHPYLGVFDFMRRILCFDESKSMIFYLVNFSKLTSTGKCIQDTNTSLMMDRTRVVNSVHGV